MLLELESWEIIIFQLFIGSLLSGVILFVFSMNAARFHVRFIKHRNSSTPIILLMALFLLMLGAIGFSIYSSLLFDPIIRLIVVIFLP